MISMNAFLHALRAAPVIAAVREPETLSATLQSPARVVFLLGGTLLRLPELVHQAQNAGKWVFIHVDLIEGLGRDSAAIDWCVRACAPHGIISTRALSIRQAHEQGLITIQRLFLMDSSALQNSERMICGAADLVELLPGVVYKAIQKLSHEMEKPVIAGGMITTSEEVQRALQCGARAVSTSQAELFGWTNA